MKKIILTITAVVGASLSGFSQGQVTFENNLANGYVSIAPNGPGSSSGGAYVQQAPSFDVACYSLNVSSLSQVAGLTAYDYLSAANLVSDGFTQDLVGGSLTPLTGANGVFGASGPTAQIAGDTTSAPAAIAVVAWTGGYSTLAAALAAGTSDIGILVIESGVGAPPQSPNIVDLATAWDSTVPSSPGSSASSDGQDLILSPVPEPGTMALAGLGSLALFLFRRKK